MAAVASCMALPSDESDAGPGDTCGVLGELESVENGPALAPGPVPEVLPLVAEDVEDVEADRLGGGGVAGPAVEAGGEQLEVGPSVGRGDDQLAVEDDVAEPG